MPDEPEAEQTADEVEHRTPGAVPSEGRTTTDLHPTRQRSSATSPPAPSATDEQRRQASTTTGWVEGRPRRYLRSTARAVPAPCRRVSSEAALTSGVRNLTPEPEAVDDPDEWQA